MSAGGRGLPGGVQGVRPGAQRRFELILFDADGTLFDFARSERVAFKACLEAFVGPGYDELAYPVYTRVSQALWRELERGNITLHELRVRRWVELSEHCELTYSAAEISVAYIDHLSRQAHVIDGAVEVCSALAARYPLGIVTNGFEAVQAARLAASPLAPHFRFLVTSEAAGAPKPARPAFERALALAPAPVAPERVLMVGDSLSSDVAGGLAMGFCTCWYAPDSPAPLAPPGASAPGAPDFVITRLEALLELVA